jgi:protein-S-isoprenylcysteine O-methyltransferase Ste14
MPTNIIAWMNFAVLVAATFLFLLFYVRSVSPAGRELIEGSGSYARAGSDRVIAIFFELVIAINYVVYSIFQINLPLPSNFPWFWWISALIAVLIGIPSFSLMIIGMRDAGEEAIRPKKDHKLYAGIYTKIRHPQAAGEVWLFMVIGFLLNSPFLVVYSLVYFPVFILMCLAEEQDLLLRYGKPYADYCRKTGAFIPKSKTGRENA